MNSIESLTPQQWKLLSKFYKDPVRFKDSTGIYTKAATFIDSTYTTGRTFAERCMMHRNNQPTVPKCSCGNYVKFSEASYKWGKTCGQKCYLNTRLPISKRVIVNGVEYKSVTKASKEYQGSLYADLFDRTKPHVIYAAAHTETCELILRKLHERLVEVEWLVEQKKNRRTIKDISAELGVSRESVTNAFLFHGISTQHDQLSAAARTILSDKSAFVAEYELVGTDVMSEKYSCSPSTILTTAHEYGCKISKTVSAIEHKIKDFILSMGFDVESSNRSLIGNELDLVIHEKKLAIELDGLYWHSERGGTNKMRHKSKYDMCNNVGYTLLRFTDYETTNKLSIVQSMIQAKLGRAVRLYARDCELGVVDSHTAKKFFDAHHLQGHSTATIYLGLYSVGTLVMCMSFAPSRFDKNHQWEIVRMASSLGTTVVGGASKILKEFRNTHSGSIMSYSDNRTGNGAGYAKLGFTMVRETEPGYFYTKGANVYSRYKFQKANIANMCTLYDATKTEYENAVANGYGRYWDCGNKVWSLQR